MTHNAEKHSHDTAKRVLLLVLALFLLSGVFPRHSSAAEAKAAEEPACTAAGDESAEDVDESESASFHSAETDRDSEIPVITSVGKSNVKVNGIKSKGKLIRYTVPVQLLKDDPAFLALMTEAEKYIGYPFVYGGSKPETGFDCSGFVCWVFTKSGVYDTGRLGANGLYAICKDIPRDEIRPGDLVFFEKTSGPDVKGITHVGIYVGNNMMIHAGDPIGFADLKDASWARKIYAFGRLPIK